MEPKETNYCYYSDLPSPMAYMQEEEELTETKKENSLTEFATETEVTNEDNPKQSEQNTHA